MMRAINPQEKAALVKFGNRLPGNERAAFLIDLNAAFVVAESKDGALIKFGIPGYERPPYHGQHSYGAEGRVFDADGSEVTVCVYADHQDRLLEVELIKWGDDPIKGVDWETLSVYP